MEIFVIQIISRMPLMQEVLSFSLLKHTSSLLYISQINSFLEDGFGRNAHSLKLGCDCVGAIHYFDTTSSDSLGNPKVIQNAICLHEEDYGLIDLISLLIS